MGFCLSNEIPNVGKMGMLTECIQEDGISYIQYTTYNGEDCNGDIMLQFKEECTKEKQCDCGQDLCPEDNLFIFEDSCISIGEQQMSTELLMVKNACIYIDTADSFFKDSNLVFGDEWTNYIGRVKVSCDAETQKLSYSFVEEDCETVIGEYSFDFAENECITITCDTHESVAGNTIKMQISN